MTEDMTIKAIRNSIVPVCEANPLSWDQPIFPVDVDQLVRNGDVPCLIPQADNHPCIETDISAASNTSDPGRLVHPEDVNNYHVDAVLVSSDTWESAMTMRAKQWIPSQLPLIRLYGEDGVSFA